MSLVTAGRYRPEIDGLRALAVVLVVGYHVWVNRVSGGVDVFLLISGFLITGQLYRAASGSGIDLGRTWARMVKRLFPAVLTVLAGVVLLSVILLPETRWNVTIRQIFAAALYLENWQLIADQADYFTDTSSSSVVQHFWSLSIQGQFYLTWPLFVGAVTLAARRTGRSLRGALILALSGALALSLAFSIVLTFRDQPTAYFHSLTRVWEFALGGLLALLIDRIHLGPALRAVLGWVGALGLVACGAVLSVGQAFPGYAALWPTGCAVAVIVAGSTGSRWSSGTLLSSRPAAYLGRLSFSLYLWHWPILVLYLSASGHAEAGLIDGAAVILTSLVLSMLTLRLIEDPVRTSRLGHRSHWHVHLVAAPALVTVLAMIGVFSVVSAAQGDYVLVADDPDHPGAVATRTNFVYAGAESTNVLPPRVALPADWGGIQGWSCSDSPRGNDLILCSRDVRQPSREVVVVGDSHMGQFSTLLNSLVLQENWHVTVMSKGGCPFSSDSSAYPGGQPCVGWNQAAMAEIIATDPDLVITAATREVRVGLTENTPPDFVDRWSLLDRHGIRVLAVRDNPRFNESPANCVARSGDVESCSVRRDRLLHAVPPYLRISGVPDSMRFLDLSDYLCTATQCPPVLGNIYVYMDSNHVSATYLRTMEPLVKAEILATLGW